MLSNLCKMRWLSAASLRHYILFLSSCSTIPAAILGSGPAGAANSSRSPPPTQKPPCCSSLAHVGSTGNCKRTFLTTPAHPCPAWFLRPTSLQCRRHNTPASFSAALRQYCTESIGENPLTDVDTPELVEMIESGDIQLFDVREPYELEETGCIPRAVNIPLGDIEEALQMSGAEFRDRYEVLKPSKSDDNIVFQCRSGVRSADAMTAAHLLGYLKARHYVRGWLGWEEFLESQNSS